MEVKNKEKAIKYAIHSLKIDNIILKDKFIEKYCKDKNLNINKKLVRKRVKSNDKTK